MSTIELATSPATEPEADFEEGAVPVEVSALPVDGAVPVEAVVSLDVEAPVLASGTFSAAPEEAVGFALHST